MKISSFFINLKSFLIWKTPIYFALSVLAYLSSPSATTLDREISCSISGSM
jgi:hypothetical protein